MDTYWDFDHSAENDETEIEKVVCSQCESEDIEAAGGDSIMHISRGMIHYSFSRCRTCGHWWMEED